MATYTVRKGDTLSAIAQSQLGAASRWRELADLNHLPNPDLIYPGQEILLPGTAPSGLLSTVADWFRSRMR